MKTKEIHVNDPEEFRRVFQAHERVIKKVAYDILHDYYMAQDVCQEVFLRLGFYFDTLPEEKRKPWLVVSAGNYAKDILRKGGKYTTTVGLPEVETVDERTPDMMERHLRELVNRDFLVTVLTRLREKKILWYEVLVLVECLEIPKKKVAEEYGMSVQSLDGHLRRAKDWIRLNYGDEYKNL